MINSYKTVYDVIFENMGRDGLLVDVERLHKMSGVSLSTVYAAVKYFENNDVFIVRRFRGSLLFLKDLSSLTHYTLNGKTFYHACVKRLVSRQGDGLISFETEPMMELSFGIEA